MIYYKKGYKYQLTKRAETQTSFRPKEDIHFEFISLYTNGILVIDKGYAWDGPSGPTFDTKDFMAGSLFHDALYQLIRNGFLDFILWRKADRFLSRVCRRCGMWKLRIKWVMAGLKLANGEAAKFENVKKIHKAPS